MIASTDRPRTSAPEDDDAPLMAQRIIVDARARTAMLRRQASAQTATVCEAAEREAEKVRNQAAAQAAAIRQAAERQAAELRAAVARQLAGADDRPAANPLPRPAAKPAVIIRKAHPAGRQTRAVRKVAAALVALCLVGVVGGAVEVDLHGFAFFIFRDAGAGAGNSQNLNENQGPGQPDAPKPQHHAAHR
jgi:hypothetical protein